MPASATPDMEATDALVEISKAHRAEPDILTNNAGRSIRRAPLAGVAGTLARRRAHHGVNYYALAAWLIRGLAPDASMRRRHIITSPLPEASPLFSVYNASKVAPSAEPD